MVQPFLATLSDVSDRRDFFIFSLILFTIETIVCCAAKNFTHLLAERAVQGISEEWIVLLTPVVMIDIVRLFQGPEYNFFLQVAWAFGIIVGSSIGGLIVQHKTW